MKRTARIGILLLLGACCAVFCSCSQSNEEANVVNNTLVDRHIDYVVSLRGEVIEMRGLTEDAPSAKVAQIGFSALRQYYLDHKNLRFCFVADMLFSQATASDNRNPWWVIEFVVEEHVCLICFLHDNGEYLATRRLMDIPIRTHGPNAETISLFTAIGGETVGTASEQAFRRLIPRLRRVSDSAALFELGP